jgi:hypothetical protein
VWGFQFLYILPYTVSWSSAILVCVRYCLTVILTCVSLMTNDTELSSCSYLYIRTFVYILWWTLVQIFAYLKIGLNTHYWVFFYHICFWCHITNLPSAHTCTAVILPNHCVSVTSMFMVCFEKKVQMTPFARGYSVSWCHLLKKQSSTDLPWFFC